MSEPVMTAQLDGALRAVRRRIRARRGVALGTVGAAVAIVVAGLGAFAAAGWPLFGLGTLALAARLWALVALPLVAGVGGAFVGDVPPERAARELDRRLGLDDAVASALAVRAAGARSPLGERVLADAETVAAGASPRIAAAFPVRPAAWSRRWLLRGALVAAILWGLALLAAFLPALPGAWRPGRPGPGVAPGETGVALAERPGADDGKDDETVEGDATREPDPKAAPERDPETADPEPPEAPREPPIRARVRTSKAEYARHERVTAVVSAVPTVELTGDTVYDVRVVLDDVEGETGLTLSVSPSRVDPTARAFDVGELPPPIPELVPGEHELSARLVPRDGGPTIETGSVRFRIRGPRDGGSANDPPPRPQPESGPQPPPPEPPPESPPQAGKERDGDPPGTPPVPEIAFEKKVVTPLFGEGEEIEKTGAVLVLDPSGGEGRPPERRTLDEALPGARRRAEALLDRSRLSERDRELVRRYFEGLARRLR